MVAQPSQELEPPANPGRFTQPNDPTYTERLAEAADNRWVHRPFFADDRLNRALEQPTTPEGRVLAALVRLAAIRKSTPALGVGRLRLFALDPRYTLTFERETEGHKVTIVANLSEHWVDIASERLGAPPRHALWSDTLFDPNKARTLEPYALLILSPAAGDPQTLPVNQEGDGMAKAIHLMARFFFLTDPDGYRIEILQRHGRYR